MQLSSIWIWLTEPATTIEQPDQRRQARFLAALLVILLVFGLTIEFILDPLLGGGLPQLNQRNAFTVIMGLAGVGYALSRTQYYTTGAIIGGLAFSIAVLVQFVRDNLATTELLNYLVIPVLLCSMFVTIRMMALVAGINLAVMILLPLWFPQTEFSEYPFTLFILVTIMMLFAAYHRNALEQMRQNELAESEERYRTLSETVFEGVALVDGDVIQTANTGFVRILGYTKEQVLGRRLSKFVDKAAQVFNRDNSYDAPELFETKGLRADGAVVDLEYVTKEYVYQGRTVQMVAVRDISERKRAEETLREAQRLDSVGVLAGGIAHDFNNMLTGILAQTSLARAKLDATHPAHAHMNKAAESATRASDLTRQLLAYAGKGRFEVKVLDLNQMVRETLALLDATLSSNIKLKFEPSDDALPIEADHGQIQQVILNLVLNAADAIQNGAGEIKVTSWRVALTQNSELPTVPGASLLSSGEYAWLSVTDTGDGMDLETRTRIFDPFYTTKESGHGLGLSAALGVVRAHKGTISVESKVGVGTTFTVMLPLATKEVEVVCPKQERTVKGNGATSPHVLVIDDETPVREAVIDILSMVDVPVISACDGHEGIQAFNANQDEIGLVILDIKMPGLSGEETLRALQSINPSVRVMLSSGYGEDETLQSFARKGISDFLQKPYDVEALITKVQGALEGKFVPAGHVA